MDGRRPVWHARTVRKYWTGAHSKHRLLVHLVFIPKYRRRILIGNVAVRLKQQICDRQACQRVVHKRREHPLYPKAGMRP